MICPKCKKEISFLYVSFSGNGIYTMTPTSTVIIKRFCYFTPDEKAALYICPECNKPIFKRSKDAEAFLNGKKIIKNKK